jgi:hypothetical protein
MCKVARHIEGGTRTEGVSEQGAEESVRIREGGSKKWVEKIV